MSNVLTREELDKLAEQWATRKQEVSWPSLNPPVVDRLLATARAGLEDRERLDWLFENGWGELPYDDPTTGGPMMFDRAALDEERRKRSGRGAKSATSPETNEEKR